ncbi:MAG TPA: hypothetical protein VJ961_07400 [Mariprofundaceae bacterium]|nr:hypothetical protein [Mariprofundaceae bacterium]
MYLHIYASRPKILVVTPKGYALIAAVCLFLAKILANTING